MSATWEIWISSPLGERIKLAVGKIGEFQVAYGFNQIGYFHIQFHKDIDESVVAMHNMVEFWSKPEGGKMDIVRCGFIKNRRFPTTGILISGPDQNDLLDTRIIAYNAGSAQAKKTDQLDDMMKACFNENLGSGATDTDRDLSAYNITDAVDLSAATSKTMTFSRKRLLNTLWKQAEAARELGNELYFDLVPVVQSDQKTIGFEFRTYTGEILDRTEGSQSPVYFGEKWKNMDNAFYEEDATKEVNFVYVGGSGVEAARNIATASNATRIGKSPFNRREAFYDYPNMSDTTELDSIAQAAVAAGRPKLYFEGEIKDTPKARFGKDWDMGTRVTCDHRGKQFDALVKYVEITVRRKKQIIRTKAEAEE